MKGSLDNRNCVVSGKELTFEFILTVKRKVTERGRRGHRMTVLRTVYDDGLARRHAPKGLVSQHPLLLIQRLAVGWKLTENFIPNWLCEFRYMLKIYGVVYKIGPGILQQAVLGTLEDPSDCWTVIDTCWLGGKKCGTGEPVCVCVCVCEYVYGVLFLSLCVCVCVLVMWDKAQWMSFCALETSPSI